jgi:hypothetical protein
MSNMSAVSEKSTEKFPTGTLVVGDSLFAQKRFLLAHGLGRNS